jgi:hypothetical protein
VSNERLAEPFLIGTLASSLIALSMSAGAAPSKVISPIPWLLDAGRFRYRHPEYLRTEDRERLLIRSAQHPRRNRDRRCMGQPRHREFIHFINAVEQAVPDGLRRRNTVRRQRARLLPLRPTSPLFFDVSVCPAESRSCRSSADLPTQATSSL